MKAFLGIDWGGTYIKAGIVNQRGRIVEKAVYASRDLKEKEVFIKQLEVLVKDLSSFKIEGVGIGAPGIVNIEKGLIYYLPNIPGWKNFPLGKVLRKKLKIPVFINNDANIFALAESSYGAAKGASRSVCLTLGTGLGGAVVFDGKLLKTAVSAHELGHVPVVLNGKKCGCGARGCIETFVGNKYLLKRYRQISKVKRNLEVKDIYQRALRGEKKAIAVWEEFSLALGKFLAGMINIFNPEVVVFGGGVAGAFSVFKPMLLKVIKLQAMWPQVSSVKLKKAKLNDPGIIGAAIMARQELS